MYHPCITEIYHWILEHTLKKDAVTVDATCGNGKDTLFLAKHSRLVYAFDIQKEAIEETKKRCAGFTNIVYVHDSHERLKDYVRENPDAVVFNFGYRPLSDHTVMTRADTSLPAVKEAMDLLGTKGILILAFYPHEEGRKEREVITQWILEENLVRTVYETKKPDAPVLYLVSKPVTK